MNSHLTTFARALLTGVFAGISATFICIIYNIIFRSETSFPFYDIFNVSSLIFGVNIIFLVIGVVYYWFIKFLKRGDLFFVALVILLTVFCIIKASGVHRTDDQVWNMQFHHLLIAMIAIWGISAVAI